MLDSTVSLNPYVSWTGSETNLGAGWPENQTFKGLVNDSSKTIAQTGFSEQTRIVRLFEQLVQRLAWSDSDFTSLSDRGTRAISAPTHARRSQSHKDSLTGNSLTEAWVNKTIDRLLSNRKLANYQLAEQLFTALLENSSLNKSSSKSSKYNTKPQAAGLSQSTTKPNSLQTVSIFDLNTNLKSSSSFYNLPYPIDLRLDAQGEPDLSAFPILDTPLLKPLKELANDRPGFPTTSAAYFRFNLPVSSQNLDRVIPARTTSPILLMDIDPASPERGKLFPTVATTPRPDLNTVPAFLLSVAPYPGIVLHPDRTYAYVVRKSLKDAFGKPLATPKALQDLINGRTPDGALGRAARQLYRPLWQTLDQIGVNRNSVAAATVLTTGDVVNQLEDLSQQVLDRYDLKIEGLKLDPVDGASHSNFYELHGTIRLPQFQQGTPPFNRDGSFVFNQQGQLVEQRTEVAPVVITIPKSPMPDGGYPLMVYYHGSDGLSTQVVDRGPITTPGGIPSPGLGPAFEVAKEGIAAVGSALPLNPERLPGGPSEAYLNLLNLSAYRDTFRQGVLEQRLLLEALENLVIPQSVFTGHSAPPLPTGKTSYQLQIEPTVVLGQSHGAQYANMMAAVEPKIRGVVPTGSPGFWSLLLAENELAPVIGLLLGTLQPLNFLYPGLQLLQTAWEAADPIAYAPRIAKNPLPNHPARSVYQPVGQGDTEVPQAVFDALALATGVEQAGPILWSTMQTSLALENLDGIVPYDVSRNRVSRNGSLYTGVVVQFAGDGIADPHTIFSQLDAVKYQYRQFFKSLLTTGTAVVPDPLTAQEDGFNLFGLLALKNLNTH